MSQYYDDSQQPKSIRYHPVDWSDFLQAQMGIIDGHIGFDKFFLGAELFHKVLLEIIQAREQGILGNQAKKIELDQKALYRIQKIWNGHTYIVNKWDDHRIEKVWCKFYYDRPKEEPDLEIIELPALDNMSPVNHIRDSTWWIQIREEVPFTYAFDGCSYEEVINGGFNQLVGMNLVPKFAREDLYSMNMKTYFVSRRYFHIVINELKNQWLKQKAILYTNLHRILQAMKYGFDDTEHNSESASDFGEV